MTTQADKRNQAAIPVSDKIGYGIGNFSTGISIQVVGAYLVFFSTAILHLPGALVGLIVSIGIVWDAVTDPVMGYISDHTKSRRFGRRHLYVIIGTIGMALVNYFIWAVSDAGSIALKFTVMLFLILLMKTFMTIYTTPYTALGAEMSTDYDERTSIQGIKTIFFLLGLVFVTVFGLYVIFQPTADYPVGQLNPAAYPMLGLTTSVLILVFGLACYFGTRKYIPILQASHKPPEQAFHLKNMIVDMIRIFKNLPFRSVAFAYMFNNLASAIVSNLGLHVFTYTFSLDSQKIAVIVGAQFATSILGQPLWTVITKKIDKKNALRLAIVISIASSLLFALLVLNRGIVSQNVLYFLPFSILAGFGLGGMFTVPLSMIADVIDQDELKSGERLEGIYFGSLTLFYKFSQSITLVLVGFLLDILKFDSTRAEQLPSTAVSLGLFFAIGSFVAFVCAYVSIGYYSLSRQKIEEIQNQLRLKGKQG